MTRPASARAWSCCSDDNSVLEALQAGARSYLTKDADRTDIARALQAAAGGLTVFDPRVHATLLAAAAVPPAPGAAASGTAASEAASPGAGGGPGRASAMRDGLTQREVEILALIEGRTPISRASRSAAGRDQSDSGSGPGGFAEYPAQDLARRRDLVVSGTS